MGWFEKRKRLTRRGNDDMLFGAHISVSAGYESVLEYAYSVGCECAQIFAKNPRQWRGPAIDPVRAEEFASAREAEGFGPIYTHTAYLINPSSTDPELREKSIAALADEIVRGALLGADGVVTHVGSDPDGDPDAAARRVADAVNRAFELAGPLGAQTRLLLENTAGAGKTFGSSFEELGSCIDYAGLPSEMLGVCLDTCHAFAWGMELGTPQGWTDVMSGIDEFCGRDRLGLIHANDCMFERGSKRDRHAWVGDGFIGYDGFAAMVSMPELSGVNVCTETAGEVPLKDVENIRRLKALREQCSPSHSDS